MPGCASCSIGRPLRPPSVRFWRPCLTWPHFALDGTDERCSHAYPGCLRRLWPPCQMPAEEPRLDCPSTAKEARPPFSAVRLTNEAVRDRGMQLGRPPTASFSTTGIISSRAETGCGAGGCMGSLAGAQAGRAHGLADGLGQCARHFVAAPAKGPPPAIQS